MSFDRSVRYPTKWLPPTASFPFGVPKNSTTETSKDGSPFEKDYISDYEGFFQGLLSRPLITVSGNPDTALVSDYMNGLYSLVGHRVESIANVPANVGIQSGHMMQLLGWHPDSNTGAGVFVWDPNKAKADHDGGVFLSPTVPVPLDFDIPSHVASYLVGSGETDPGGSGCWVRKERLIIDPAMYGAYATGILTDSQSIQATFDYIGIIKGTAHLIAFKYLTDVTLYIYTDDVTIIGNGNNTNIIRTDGDFGDTLVIESPDPTTTTIFNVTVNNLRFDCTVEMNSGAHIKATECAYFNMNNLSLQNGFKGLHIRGMRASFIDNLHIRSGQHFTALKAGSKFCHIEDSPNPSSFSENVETFMSNFNFTINGLDSFVEHGLHIEEADGFWFSDGHVRGAKASNGFIDSAGTPQLLGLKFDNVWFDGATDRCLLMDGATANFVGLIQFNDCTFTGGLVHGVHIAANIDLENVQFNNCHTGFIDSQIAWQLEAGKMIDMNGCTFSTINASNVAASSCVLVGAGVEACNIDGGSISRSPNVDFVINCAGGATETLNVNNFVFKDLADSAKTIFLDNPGIINFNTSGCTTDQTSRYVPGNQQWGEFADVLDDTAVSVPIGEVFGGMLAVNLKFNQQAGGIISLETLDPAATSILVGQFNLDVTTGVLTGTTGTDGKLTVSVTDAGILYFENRTGVTRNIVWRMLLRDFSD